MGLALYGVGIAAWLLVNNMPLTLEDGFYYFKIAQHVAYGAGSTFDGLNLTNGYHPLWLLCLVPIFWLTSTPGTALTLGIILQAVFMIAATILVYHTARLSVGRFAASLAALLWVTLTYQVSLGGLEFSLHAFGMLAVAYVYLRWFAQKSPQQVWLYLGLGLLLGLTFLARLDTILLAGVISLWLSWRELKGGLTLNRSQRLLALWMPILLSCLIYTGANLILFGHPLPISGLIKRTWSAYLLAQDPHYLKYGWLAAKFYQLLWPLLHLNRLFSLVLALGTFGVSGLWLIELWGRRAVPRLNWFDPFLRPWQPFILFSLLNFLSYVLLYHGYLSFPPWYYVIQPWLSTLLVATFVDRVVSGWVLRGTQPTRRLLRGVQGLVLVGMVAVWWSVPLYTAWDLEQWRVSEQLGTSRQPLYEGAQWVKANLPVDATIGSWNAGAIGYLSGRRVVNLDGLVNSWEYYQTKRYDLCHYWQEMGITYLVDVFDHRFEHHQAAAPEPTYPYYARCGDRLKLVWSDNRHATFWRLEVYQVRLPDN